MICSKCKTREALSYHRYCLECKREHYNNWVNSRGGHWKSLTPTQKHKAVVRQYIKALVKRGKIERQPCAVCKNPTAEIHHLDYQPKTRNVIWLCEEHHVKAEQVKRDNSKPLAIEWTPDPRRKPVLERMAHKSIVSDDGCWLWQGCCEGAHGRIGHNGEVLRVHRLAWELFNGAIPADKWVLHKCIGHGNCWNPNHLYLGDALQNVQDRVEQGRKGNVSGAKNGRAILTIEQIAWIRKHYEPHSKKGMNTVRIAKVLGVSQSAVWFVVSNTTWKQSSLDAMQSVA